VAAGGCVSDERAGGGWRACPQVGVERGEALGGYGEDVLVAAFASDDEEAGVAVEVVDLESGDVDAAEPEVQHEHDDGVRSGVGEVVEKGADLVAGEDAR
jgi:hypothetical protein